MENKPNFLGRQQSQSISIVHRVSLTHESQGTELVYRLILYFFGGELLECLSQDVSNWNTGLTFSVDHTHGL